MVAAKSSRVNRQYKKKYRIRNWRGVRAWPQEPRRRHDLAERGCNCRVGTTEERSSRRPAAVLEPRGPDRVDPAGRLQPAASPDGLLAPLEVPIRRFTADGTYDHRSVYDRASAAGTENVVIVIPPRRSAVSAGPTDGQWAQRDTALERIRQVGRRECRRSRATDSRRALKTASSDTSPCSEAD